VLDDGPHGGDTRGDQHLVRGHAAAGEYAADDLAARRRQAGTYTVNYRVSRADRQGQPASVADSAAASASSIADEPVPARVGPGGSVDPRRLRRAAGEIERSLERLDLNGLRALRPGLRSYETRAPSRERAEAVALDRGVVHEQIRARLVRRDEAEALLVVEPLDGSGAMLLSLHGVLCCAAVAEVAM
jgi:hypothetical protein